MDKVEAAKALGVSVRRVEALDSAGRLGEKVYVRSKTGKRRDFTAEAVEALRFELESEDRGAEAPHSPAGALARLPNPQALAQLAEAIAGAVRPVDTRPTWLTKAEAVAASGLPVTWIERATRGDKPALRHIGKGRAWRVHRDELLKFAEGFRSAEDGR